MSTKMTLEISSFSSDETEHFGEILGRHLNGGEIIELVSDLGGGKTTFTRGLARGIGSNDHVSSPTFKVCNVYKGSALTMYHYDFYRLSEAGLIEHELEDTLVDNQAVTVIEWGNVVQNALPADRVTVHIQTVSDSARTIAYSYPKQLKYVVGK